MIRRLSVSGWCAGLILLVTLRGALAGEAPAATEVARQAQQLLESNVPADGPGVAVLVARGDEILFRGARGMAQMELGVPLRAEHVFRIGSNTKQFAAATVLKLVQQGKLSLNDPLSKFVPAYPNGGNITVHQLLNHTSGIKNYTEIEGYMDAGVRTDVDTEKLIAVFKDQPSDFPPGTDFKYDNSGYVLVGAIIEKVTGKPWYEAINEIVLAPLSLKHTGYGGDLPLIPGRAAGYSVDEQGHTTNAVYLSMTQPGAGGGMVSTVDDLFHWMRALHTGKVLDADSYHRMITPVPTPSGKPTDYGYGMSTRTLRGEKALEHGGGIPGFASDTIYFPESAVSVVVLANTDSGNPYTSLLMSKLAADALGKPYPDRHPVKLPETTMQSLVGVYDIGEGQRRLVTVRDGTLYTQRQGGAPHALLAASSGELYFNEVLDYFTVTRDAAGKVTALEKFQDGEGPAEHEPKIADTVPAEPPKK